MQQNHPSQIIEKGSLMSPSLANSMSSLFTSEQIDDEILEGEKHYFHNSVSSNSQQTNHSNTKTNPCLFRNPAAMLKHLAVREQLAKENITSKWVPITLEDAVKESFIMPRRDVYFRGHEVHTPGTPVAIRPLPGVAPGSAIKPGIIGGGSSSPILRGNGGAARAGTGQFGEGRGGKITPPNHLRVVSPVTSPVSIEIDNISTGSRMRSIGRNSSEVQSLGTTTVNLTALSRIELVNSSSLAVAYKNLLNEAIAKNKKKSDNNNHSKEKNTTFRKSNAAGFKGRPAAECISLSGRIAKCLAPFPEQLRFIKYGNMPNTAMQNGTWKTLRLTKTLASRPMTSSSANPRIKSIKIVSGNRTNENPNHKRIDEFFLDEETPETVPFISGITTFKNFNLDPHAITEKRPFPNRKPPEAVISHALVNIDWGTEPIDLELDVYRKVVKNRAICRKRVL